MKQGWEYKKLNEVCDKGSSNIVINKLIDNNGDYPLYGASGLIKNIDFYHQDKRYIGIVKDGAGVGRVNIYPAFSSLVGTMQYIFPKEGYSLDFIKYFLIKLDLSHCVSGATIPHIYFKDYGKELIPTPSLDTQQTIVSELDKINELIRLKKEQLKDFDNLAQSIFYEMFGDPVENEMGWEVKKLGDVCRQITDGTHNSPTNTKNGDFKYVTAKNIKKEGIVLDNITYVDADTHHSIYSRCNPEYGDILYIKDGATTGIATINNLNEEFSLLSSVALLKLEDKIMNYYLKAVLNTPSLYNCIRTNMGGAAITRLTLVKIKAIKIPLPPLPLQHLFAQRIEQIEHQKAEVQKAIADLETLLASRMQYWFE